ncbi:carboxymuconolactone decarboxylase family protein [Klebsiella michiganensis]|uniref:carboxymuconolactone decarboxylase family protein n=1 Tax=Klebsiella michiganensis TaxID=1134687 RepID=UPI002DB8BD53|nr:carboxymuconolactone decarboxylase family protein [Klebsiella michiganensis]MEB8078480.1 carboxymuconolactone decarboxylase family protein [Klebsiella michiganensis]
MSLPPLKSIPLILRPQAWLHRRHYGEVLSPIRWWGRIPLVFYLVSMFVGYLERKRSPLDPVLRSLVSARERLALEYAEAASMTPPVVDDALRDRLAGQFDARALTELTALIGLQNLSARFNSAMAIPAQGLCRIPTDSKP